MSNDRTRCPILAHFRYTWPGADESWICVGHAPQLLGVANAIGLQLQLVPLGPEEIGKHTCQQFLSAEEQDRIRQLERTESPEDTKP